LLLPNYLFPQIVHPHILSIISTPKHLWILPDVHSSTPEPTWTLHDRLLHSHSDFSCERCHLLLRPMIYHLRLVSLTLWSGAYL
jgi:hypothetical protein